MIKKVTIINKDNESLELELASPEKSGLLVAGMEGIGPVNANIATTELAGSDGSVFNSARLVSRNIMLYLRYMWAPTIADSRLKAYKYLRVKSKITIIIETDLRTVRTTGYVESNEAIIFTQKSGSNVSIICPSSYFESEDVQTTVLAGVKNMFSFPFANNSLTEDLIVFGDLPVANASVLTYVGDAATGITVVFKATGNITNPVIYNARTKETFKIDTTKLETLTGQGIVAGDEITLCTVAGSKYLTLLRQGVETNILNCRDLTSKWIKVEPGDNTFSFTADSGSQAIDVTITNRTLYEGV